MKYSIPIFAAVMLLGYLLGSFVLWDYNPGNWGYIDRAITIFVSVFLALGLASANYR